MRGIWLSAGLLGWPLLTGCTPLPAADTLCVFPGTSPMLVAKLFFGRGNVTDAGWASFAETLTAKFPDGFTVLDAAGQWREAPGQPTARESSQMVIVAAPDTQATRDRLMETMAVYRGRFDQKSVGLVLEHACASF